MPYLVLTYADGETQKIPLDGEARVNVPSVGGPTQAAFGAFGLLSAEYSDSDDEPADAKPAKKK